MTHLCPCGNPGYLRGPSIEEPLHCTGRLAARCEAMQASKYAWWMPQHRTVTFKTVAVPCCFLLQNSKLVRYLLPSRIDRRPVHIYQWWGVSRRGSKETRPWLAGRPSESRVANNALRHDVRLKALLSVAVSPNTTRKCSTPLASTRRCIPCKVKHRKVTYILNYPQPIVGGALKSAHSTPQLIMRALTEVLAYRDDILVSVATAAQPSGS